MKFATVVAVIVQLALAAVLFAAGFPWAGALFLFGAGIWAAGRRDAPRHRDAATHFRRQAAAWALVGVAFAVLAVLAILDALEGTRWFPYLALLTALVAWSLAARMWRHAANT